MRVSDCSSDVCSSDLGTSARMGPGYFPFWLCIALTVLGIIVSLRALSLKAEILQLDGFDWKIVIIVVGSVALCGVVFDYLGVYISVFLLVLVSSIASHRFRWKVALINAAFLTIFVWIVFIKGLGLVFPMLPSLTGN